MKIAILGAGLSGLSSAWILSEKKGLEVDVIEKHGVVGGLAKSVTFDGFTADLGPHRFHSDDGRIIGRINALFDNQLQLKNRKSRIYMQGRFFDYPLKPVNAIWTMPPLTSLHILVDYIRVKFQNHGDNSFEDWVVNRFGRTLYDIYFGPYTEKLWGISPSKISPEWASERITLLGLGDAIKKSLIKPKNTPRTYISRFYYPKSGGIGEISKRISERVVSNEGKIYLDSRMIGFGVSKNRIESITLEKRGAKKYDIVVSSIPITELVKLLPDVPNEVVEAANRLRFRAVIFAYLTVGNKNISDDHWIYIPDKSIIFNRISEPRNFSINNTPLDKNVMCAEITCDYGDGVWNMNENSLIDRIKDDVGELGFARKGEIVSWFIHRERYAYPIYDLDYKKNLDVVKRHLKNIRNLTLMGRSGLFRYDNMDQSIEGGLDAGKRIGKDEK